MWDKTVGQIEDIHAMLSAGHRSVQIERHTLTLWGITTALLIVVINTVFTPERFPIHWQRTVVTNSLIAIMVTAIAILDFRLTRQKREQRDETLSFVQQQLTKVWWFLIALIVLLNIGMNIFGGGYLFYPALIILVGFGLYIQGLFSQQLLAWHGHLMILTGIATMLLRLPFDDIEWFTVCLFGAGLPLLGKLIDMPQSPKKWTSRLLLSLAWLALIVGLSIGSYKLTQRSYEPNAPIFDLTQYRQLTQPQGEHVINLPAGTVIPLEINIDGTLVRGESSTTVPLTLTKTIAITVSNGKPDGRYRVDAGEWLKPRAKLNIRAFKLESHLTPAQGPKLKLDLFVRSEE